MYITKLLTLSTMISSVLLTFGILSSPTISFSQQGQASEVIITLGAADEGNFEPYAPRAINVMPGSIVSWTNEDMTPHTVTANNNLFDAGPISPGDTFENVFDTPGELGYHCSIHPWMTGRVMVG
ncbi:MAG TPA: plastocyanin/azurin family copper-binding protein [Nitrososphaeraceae archaeon]